MGIIGIFMVINASWLWEQEKKFGKYVRNKLQARRNNKSFRESMRKELDPPESKKKK